MACGELNWTGDSIDAIGPIGYDGVWLEGEHGPLDYSAMGDLGRACDLWGMTAIARVAKSLDQVDENAIYRTLDRGLQGVIVPHINTKAEAEMVRHSWPCSCTCPALPRPASEVLASLRLAALRCKPPPADVSGCEVICGRAQVVAASKFKNEEFPMGRRGMFLSRQGFGVQDYYMQANHETMTVILIEDIIAINNLAEILTVDHIDVFHVAFAVSPPSHLY